MRLSVLCLTVAMLLASGLAGAAPARRAAPREGDLKVGDKAPDFTLKLLGSQKKFTLSSNFGRRPTVLIFGSYS